MSIFLFSLFYLFFFCMFILLFLFLFFFFFQAEDGIRDGRVTGVQTCALPIYLDWPILNSDALPGLAIAACLVGAGWLTSWLPYVSDVDKLFRAAGSLCGVLLARSEERRVGKSVDLGGRRIIKKKTMEGEAEKK